MASSQVEFATASPFGCVLRDHNSRRDRRRDTNTNPNPSPKSQRNFKDLVRDHLQSCISLSPRALKNHERDENSDQCGGFSCFGGGTNANSSRMRAKEVNKQKQAQGQAGDKAQGENQPSFITGSAKKEPRELSLARSDSGCSDISVSSLVQKWRGLEANHGAAASSPTTMEEGVTRMNSGVSTCECESTVTTLDEIGEKEEMSTTTTTEEEEMEEKEKRDREGVRVVDIVRKWPVDESGACLARSETRKENKGKGEGEGKKISPRLVSSARIRGRQAIVDVFMRMERERYRELGLLQSKHVVAKFPKRGRIQALLRLRLLRRDQNIEEQQRPPLPVVGTSWCHATPAVTSRREKFHSSVDQDSVSSRTTSKETPNTSHKHTQTTSTSKQQITEKATPKHEPIVRKSLTEPANSEPGTENASESSKQAVQISEKQNVRIICDKSKKIGPKEELNVPNHPNNNVGAENLLTSNGNFEPESSCNCGYWEQGEGEDYYYQDNEASQCYYEPNLDWVNDIARPRSYWEDIRQAWYQEVFNTKSQDEEIRQLLERGSVSNVLASDFKERMERLILNSTTHFSSYNHVEVGSDNEQSVSEQNTRQLLQSGCVSAVLSSDFRERMNQVFMKRMQIEDEEQEDNEEEEYEQENSETVGEREDESLVIHRYQNVGDFYEQNSTPSPPLHWDQHDHEVYYSDHATSYGHTTHEGSFSSKNPSIEMELIYDLRSHMEHLYREMAELRKSVTSCMDMQMMKTQHSTKEKVSAAIIRKEQAEKKDSSNRRKPKKGTCCICYEKKVDSLLYRCGHMCTCFTCANELQWGSGKCPICRAQIIDVVRAHPDS